MIFSQPVYMQYAHYASHRDMICSLMTKNISEFSEKQHHKSTRSKQQGENNCLPIPVQLDNLEVATNFLPRIIPLSNIKFFSIFIFKNILILDLPKRASSLINIMLARRRKSEVILPSEKNIHLTIPRLLIWSQKG